MGDDSPRFCEVQQGGNLRGVTSKVNGPAYAFCVNRPPGAPRPLDYSRRMSLKMRNAMNPISKIIPTCWATSRTRTEGRRRVTAS